MEPVEDPRCTQCMRFLRWVSVAASLALVAGCSASSARHPVSAPVVPGTSAASGTTAVVGAIPTPLNTAPMGSVQRPFVTEHCRAGVPTPPDTDDITAGPLSLPGYQRLAAATGPDGSGPYQTSAGIIDFYKEGFHVVPGNTVTVTIGATARGYARLVTEDLTVDPGAESITYVAGSYGADMCWYVGGFNLLGGRTTGCVPLDVAVKGETAVRHIIVSLRAGKCPAA